ncbi:MAG: hypothetical protein KDA87_22810 [Planctomycetales bacterium]|nr:hypothetical protein [Planctomycetales bacterium]
MDRSRDFLTNLEQDIITDVFAALDETMPTFAQKLAVKHGTSVDHVNVHLYRLLAWYATYHMAVNCSSIRADCPVENGMADFAKKNHQELIDGLTNLVGKGLI